MLVKEKGYLSQNKLYQKRTAYDFIETLKLRNDFYDKIIKKYSYLENHHQKFNLEINSWNMKETLTTIFKEDN